MKKIDEMIKQLCPNGVEIVPLWSVTAWDKKFNAVDKSMQSKIIKYPYLLAKDLFALDTPEGSIKLLSTGTQSGWTTEEKAGNYLCDGEVVTIPWGKSSKVINLIKYYKGKFVTADNRIATSLDKDILNNKYLFYWMLSESDVIDSYYRGAGIKHPSMYNVLTMQIPLPPLSIQKEIVSVLDKFSELIEKTDEEIALRQKQYEYYREKLLTFEKGEDCKEMSLGKIGKMKRGNGLQKSDFRANGFPCIHYGQIHTSYGLEAKETISFCEESLAAKLKKAKHGDLLIATTSEDVEACCKAVVWLGNEEVAYSGDSFCFSHNQNPKYISYLFCSEQFAKQKRKVATGAKVVRVSGDAMEKFTFLFPSLSRQQSIVDTLDKFESLISKLKDERELRQKQYEYYREKLLTF